MDAKRILVLDANQRSALAVTRSLGRRGIEVVTADSSASALAAHSRYCCDYLRYPSPVNGAREFLRWLEALLPALRPAVVFPMTEVTSRLLLQNAGALGRCRLPFAALDTVLALADKGQVLRRAEALGIPAPAYQYYAGADAVTGSPLPDFPLVIKPCLSHNLWRDRWIEGRVRKIDDAAQLQRHLSEDPCLRHFPFMLQQYIPGHGAGVFALYDRGRAVAFFAHRRLREKPPGGGVSVLSESVAVDTALRHYAKTLLDSVRWHGVAMVEFRIGSGGKPYLMEVNTRFWGSLQLAIDAGVDFPWLLWRLARGEAPEAVESYREGQRLRWFLGDLDHLYLTLRHAPLPLRRKLISLLRFLAPQKQPCRHEVNRWHDLGPAAAELRQYLLPIGDKKH